MSAGRRDIAHLPSALTALDRLATGARGRAVVCVDYDGTLTPIAARPELALLAPETRAALRALARRCVVAVITGRDLADVQQLVDLEELYFAGCHGLRMVGPGGASLLEKGAAFAAEVRAVTRQLRRRVAEMDGVRVEPKELSVALHFRQAPHREHQLRRLVRAMTSADHPRLTVHPGRKVLELRPRLDWHKGHAVTWLLQRLEQQGPLGPVYFLGDDLTDEDAFAVLADRPGAAGIALRDRPRETFARYALEDTEEVRRFLVELQERL